MTPERGRPRYGRSRAAAIGTATHAMRYARSNAQVQSEVEPPIERHSLLGLVVAQAQGMNAAKTKTVRGGYGAAVSSIVLKARIR
jgi:hypothetical protein